MQRPIIFLTVLILCLAACTPALPEGATPAVSNTPAVATTRAAATDPLDLFATQTQSAGAALTATVQGQVSQPATPAYTPSPLPAVTQALGDAGPFRQVSRQEAPVLGRVLDLQPADGGMLLLSEGGVSFYQDDDWTGYLTQLTGYLVGVDATQRAWAAAADGSDISQSDFTVNRHRGEDEDVLIWIQHLPELGWIPITTTIGSPVNYGLVTDSSGGIWFTTQRDVRRFSIPWQIYDSQSMGMPPLAGDDTSEFTLYPIQSSGEIYAGRCDWGSKGPVGGGGWRVFDGRGWSLPDTALSGGCVSALAQDDSGSVWIAQDANLWRYEPASAALEQVVVPEPPQPYRFGYFSSLTAGPDNSLWAQISLCSEVDCFSGEALYRLKDGSWEQIGEPNPAAGQKLLFDKNGTPWLLSAGGIYQVVEDTLQPVPGLLVQAAATDDAGDLWLLAQASGPPTLWKLNP